MSAARRESPPAKPGIGPGLVKTRSRVARASAATAVCGSICGSASAPAAVDRAAGGDSPAQRNSSGPFHVSPWEAFSVWRGTARRFSARDARRGRASPAERPETERSAGGDPAFIVCDSPALSDAAGSKKSSRTVRGGAGLPSVRLSAREVYGHWKSSFVAPLYSIDPRLQRGEGQGEKTGLTRRSTGEIGVRSPGSRLAAAQRLPTHSANRQERRFRGAGPDLAADGFSSRRQPLPSRCAP